MARRRGAEQPTVQQVEAVPPELTDPRASTWSSPIAFRAWCTSHLGRELSFIPLADQSAAHRFNRAVEAWSSDHGIQCRGEFGGTDWQRLADLGVHRPRRLRSVAN